jgi:hypothetical protein
MTEHDTAEFLLGDFQASTSRTVEQLREIYPHGTWTRDSLSSFATVIGTIAGVRVGRNFTRRKDLLIKWFEDHYDVLEPYFRYISFD